MTTVVVSTTLTRAAAALACILCICCSAPMAAAATGNPDISMSVTPLYQAAADLDSAGDISLFRLQVSASGVVRASEQTSLRVSAGYGLADYGFSTDSTFAGGAPWDRVHSMDLSVGISCTAVPRWRFTATPAMRIAREDGAGWKNALQFGGSLSFSHDISDTFSVGIGAAVFSQLEEVTAVPLLQINWQLSDRLALANPLRTGFTSPAGLELSYRFAPGWQLATGAAYRSERFRLSHTGTYPDGIGEVVGIPAWTRLSRNIGVLSLDLQGGIVLAGSLRVDDSAGRRLTSIQHDPAPFMTVTATARF